jgi:FkbM family methyltransferase
LIVLPGMTVLDIGANIGAHTVELSRLAGSTGAVHAFEPQRLMFQLLCANVALNSCGNVFTHHVAVGAVGGVSLVPALDPETAANFGALSLPDALQGETVPLVTVDGLALPACHMIRIDVEGMETEVLRGGAVTIAAFRPILYVRNGHEARSAELIGLLQSYGYRLYWYLPPIYSPDNFRGDPANIFPDAISPNMLCVAAEVPQASLSALREVSGPDDRWQD